MKYKNLIEEFKGKICWKAALTHGTMFLLNLGEKVWDEIGKREVGEYAILVDSSGWTLLKNEAIIVTPQESDSEKLAVGLKKIESEKIILVQQNNNIVVEFSNNLKLIVPREITFYTPSHSIAFHRGELVHIEETNTSKL